MRSVYKIIGVLIVSALFVLSVKPVWAADNSSTKSLDYLARHIDSTGGVFEEGEIDPTGLLSAWTAVAFASAGYNPSSINGKSIVEYVEKDACSLSSITDIERTVLVASSAGLDASNFGGCNLINKITESTNIDTGQIGNDIVSTIFGVLAIRSQGKLVDSTTTDYIINAQEESGGWNSGWGAEVNITSQAVMALVAAQYDINSTVIDNAKQYLKSLQTVSGGMKYDMSEWTTESDAFSDAYTLQAIYALGENPDSNYWTVEGKSIVDDLSSLRQSDGSYNFSATFGAMNPVYTTAIVLPAISGKPLPVIGQDLQKFSSTPAAEEEVEPTPTPVPSDQSAAAEDTTTETVKTLPAPTLEDYTQNQSNSAEVEADMPDSSQDTSPILKESSADADKGSNRTTVLVVCITGLILGVGLSLILGRTGILPLLLLLLIAVPASTLASQAGVVVRHGNGEIKKACVDFEGKSINGLELLKRAGFSPQLENGFVIEVDGEKAKASTDAGVKEDYWSYWLIADGSWLYARAGAKWQKVGDGDVNGWQKGGTTLMLPSVKFGDICSKKAEDVAVATGSATATETAQTTTASGTVSPSETTASTTSAPNDQTDVSTPAQQKSNTQNKKEDNNYTLVLLFIGLIILGFSAHRIYLKRMRFSKK